jgi:hypothetical protein
MASNWHLTHHNIHNVPRQSPSSPGILWPHRLWMPSHTPYCSWVHQWLQALVGCASETAMNGRWAAVPCWRGKWLIALRLTKPVLGYLIGASYNNEIKDNVYQLVCHKPCRRVYRDPRDDRIKKLAASLSWVVCLSLCNTIMMITEPPAKTKQYERLLLGAWVYGTTFKYQNTDANTNLPKYNFPNK